MKQYIDKSALMAEIERIIDEEKESINSFEHHKNESEKQRYNARMALMEHILHFLDTLEVKEVDFEKALDNFYKQEDWSPTDAIEYDTHKDIARHFFELGLKARKEK